ncbi:MAG: 16S rRNA (uracil(1498)-N(3))-methyltransferase [bacterium]|nr:16S rRNA (uracil(1498)-N(3))-methyltransferase [bacterium]MDD5354548.1 16S rRNA (uracil(1498)-N(3))-methyltransferase [bacterium]
MKKNLHRFYVPQKNILDNTVIFPAEHANHIKNVLRMKTGDYCLVFDGTGFEYELLLEKIFPEPEGRIMSRYIAGTPDKTRITLVQALAKGDKMDLIIQKCSEIGVDIFIPCKSERTIIKLDQAGAVKKQERWQKIAQSAAEQSHRITIPKVEPVTDLAAVLNEAKPGQMAIIPWENEKTTSLKQALNGSEARDIIYFIGPEGGFSEQEIAAAQKAGVLPVSLGQRILRTETAGIVVAAILRYELD